MTITVRLAEASDATALAALHKLPMQGMVKLSMRTAPAKGDRVVVAERDGELVAMGIRHRSLHRFGGECRRVGVLGGMRSSLPVMPRRATTDMYRLLREARDRDDPDWDLTAILTGNTRARRLLEAGLPWLPRYRLAREMVTLTFRTGTGLWKPSPSCLALETSVATTNAAAVVVRNPSRKTTISGYAGWLAKIRPVVDRALRLSGRPGLPPVGTTLSESFATETCWTPGDRANLTHLVKAIAKAAREMETEIVHWGVPADHPDLTWLAGHLRAWRTSSRVYQVHDPEKIPPRLEGFWPEIHQL